MSSAIETLNYELGGQLVMVGAGALIAAAIILAPISGGASLVGIPLAVSIATISLTGIGGVFEASMNYNEGRGGDEFILEEQYGLC